MNVARLDSVRYTTLFLAGIGLVTGFLLNQQDIITGESGFTAFSSE